LTSLPKAEEDAGMTVWASRYSERFVASPWLALLGVLALSQTAHLFEHVAQMVQMHVLGLSGASARGIVGQFDIEWVHFVWNAWVLAALLVVLSRFRMNPWLLGVTLFAGWRFMEHVTMIATYLRTGVVGSPGFLSSGGLILGGLPIGRPDLHFLYNLAETVPLLIGWVVELRPSELRAPA
jgi:hypothetical protein